MLVDFNIISEKSRLWVYGSEDILSDNHQDYLINSISEYLKTWEYHSQPLRSAVAIFENRFIMIALDDQDYGVGGCSIDSLQKIIQELERELNLSLLNRLNVFCKIGKEIRCIPTSNLKDIANNDTYFFDLTIQKKYEINSYLKPIRDGWCSKFLSNNV